MNIAGGEIGWAASCYLVDGAIGRRLATSLPANWPWEGEWWKPSTDPVRNLVKAGALIASEIDRLKWRAKR
jgi:hypothetical protein